MTLTPPQKTAIVFAGLPLLGFAASLAILMTTGMHPLQHAVFAVLYIISGLGVELGYHRYFSHGSFKCGRKTELLLALAGSTAAVGSVLFWCEIHGRHHPTADGPDDPHTPQPRKPGFWPALKSFTHAHLTWALGDLKITSLKGSKELLRNPVVTRADSLYHPTVLASVLFAAACGGLVTQSLQGALHGLLWGGLGRIFLIHNAISLGNSLCHLAGKRAFKTRDQSRNVTWVALLNFGMGWHNNHHAFPGSARAGLLRFQPDFAWLALKGLKLSGLAWDLRLPSQESLSERRLEPS